MIWINLHCPQSTWVATGGGGRCGWFGRPESPLQPSLLSASSAATSAGTSAINATREKMVAKYFIDGKRWGWLWDAQGEVNAMEWRLNSHLVGWFYTKKKCVEQGMTSMKISLRPQAPFWFCGWQQRSFELFYDYPSLVWVWISNSNAESFFKKTSNFEYTHRTNLYWEPTTSVKNACQIICYMPRRSEIHHKNQVCETSRLRLRSNPRIVWRQDQELNSKRFNE